MTYEYIQDLIVFMIADTIQQLTTKRFNEFESLSFSY